MTPRSVAAGVCSCLPGCTKGRSDSAGGGNGVSDRVADAVNAESGPCQCEQCQGNKKEPGATIKVL
ncbi:hypothetical protein NCCP2145_31570 [Pseudarthrobacter sp. NCCP-2145]|nr:hypothetical protein NCCP2145_31570 [Pseudarthrobacter sp. NCCP-2145]